MQLEQYRSRCSLESLSQLEEPSVPITVKIVIVTCAVDGDSQGSRLGMGEESVRVRGK